MFAVLWEQMRLPPPRTRGGGSIVGTTQHEAVLVGFLLHTSLQGLATREEVVDHCRNVQRFLEQYIPKGAAHQHRSALIFDLVGLIAAHTHGIYS